jgi:RNA polymerase sigma-70 factor, ECF subfamily
VIRPGPAIANSCMPGPPRRSAPPWSGWRGGTNAIQTSVATYCRRSIALWRSLARFDGRCSLRTWVYRVAHNTAISKALRPRTSAPTLVALDASLESPAPANSEEQALDRRRTLERLHELIRQLRPLDRQVMLLYLEQVDAASIAEITGLSAANVTTKVRRIKQILVQRFHEGKGHEQSFRG